MAASIPVPLALGRFKQLPQRESKVRQGSIRTMPVWIDNPDDPGGPPYRPIAVFWVSLRTGLLHSWGSATLDRIPPASRCSSLLEFGTKWATLSTGVRDEFSSTMSACATCWRSR